MIEISDIEFQDLGKQHLLVVLDRLKLNDHMLASFITLHSVFKIRNIIFFMQYALNYPNLQETTSLVQKYLLSIDVENLLNYDFCLGKCISKFSCLVACKCKDYISPIEKAIKYLPDIKYWIFQKDQFISYLVKMVSIICGKQFIINVLQKPKLINYLFHVDHLECYISTSNFFANKGLEYIQEIIENTENQNLEKLVILSLNNYGLRELNVFWCWDNRLNPRALLTLEFYRNDLKYMKNFYMQDMENLSEITKMSFYQNYYLYTMNNRR